MFLSHAVRDSVKTLPPCLWLLNPLPYTLHDGGSQDGMRISAYVPPVLGADAFQAYLLKIGEDNPLVIYEGHFWLGIAGWRVPCYNDFVEEWDAGCIVKTSGTHPDPSVKCSPGSRISGSTCTDSKLIPVKRCVSSRTRCTAYND